jgi:hypothetical protein
MRLSSVVIILAAAFPSMAAAQPPERHAFEVSGGYAAFVDESMIEHATLGAGWRWRPTPRLAIGPELVFMQGPGLDRDVFVTGKVTFGGRPEAPVSGYVVADGGLMLHRAPFPFRAGPVWHREGAASVGGGVRVNVGERVYLAPEARLGWEPHLRFTLTVGFR